MKLELDYDCKTITVKDQVNLKDFIKEVKNLGLDLKKWSVISETISYSYPIITYPQPYYHTDWQITCGTENIDLHGNCDTITNISTDGGTDGTSSLSNYPYTLTN